MSMNDNPKEESKHLDSERKFEDTCSPNRNPTASIFSRDTNNDLGTEASKNLMNVYK